MKQIIRRYSDLKLLATFEERYQFLRITGSVGRSTFGYDRVFNQEFYRSTEWRLARRQVIVRDNGRDLGIEGFEIGGVITVHHMNPLTLNDIENNIRRILDPEYLICVSGSTHLAIHYGDESNLIRLSKPREPGDTNLW
jgi:hypothetical protein